MHILAMQALRFIPAPAGNVRSISILIVAFSVHPRTCGERNDNTPAIAVVAGSSPHLRGTLFMVLGKTRNRRFIPAPAGNVLLSMFVAMPMAVHPRTCGERACVNTASTLFAGSSPHLRGTLRTAHSILGKSRFIPAPAGNVLSSVQRIESGAVHPRTCGERLRTAHSILGKSGSSPHLRGTSAQ